jgi:3',5'-cyclic AMP phosphodiesterase CpdA
MWKSTRWLAEMKRRLAHFSDIHFTVSPLALDPFLLRGKRLAGSLNYYLGRGRRFAAVQERIKALLDDVDSQAADHVLCTGDLTAVSAPAEFAGCAQLFGHRLTQPHRFTVIPGNHDRYTPDAVERRLFEGTFGSLSPEPFPWRKRLMDGVTLVALDVTRPCALLDSSGLCGAAQLSALRQLLIDPALQGELVIVALHYGLLTRFGTRDRRSHGIRDDKSLLSLLADPQVHVDLVLHGHMHQAYCALHAGRTMICAGSATDLRHGCGYNLYTLDLPARTLEIHRRAYSAAERRYVSVETPHLLRCSSLLGSP